MRIPVGSWCYQPLGVNVLGKQTNEYMTPSFASLEEDPRLLRRGRRLTPGQQHCAEHDRQPLHRSALVARLARRARLVVIRHR